MFKNILFIFVFLLTTIFIPIIFIILKPIAFLFGIKLDWHKTTGIFINYLCGCNYEIINKNKLIEEGYILCNHRSWFDFGYDPYITNASIVGRREAFWAMSFQYILGLFDNRMIVFNRGKTTRNELFKQVSEHIQSTCSKSVVIYPEGSRQNYTTLSSKDDVKKKLKFGFLKSIYDENNSIPIQLCITSNKDKVFNEKQLSIQYNTKVKTIFSDKIIPSNYSSFDDFIDDLCLIWFDCWKKTHL